MSNENNIENVKSISAEEGLIAIAYEGKLDVYSRLYQVIFLLIRFFRSAWTSIVRYVRMSS